MIMTEDRQVNVSTSAGLFKCCDNGTLFSKTQNSVDNISTKNNRVPDFFIKTILSRVPERNDYDRQCNFANSLNASHVSTSFDNRINSASVICQFRTLSGLLGGKNFLSCRPTYDPFGVFHNRQSVAIAHTSEATAYRSYETHSANNVEARRLQWQKIFLSTLGQTNASVYARCHENFAAHSLLSREYNCNFDLRHFANRSNENNTNADKCVNSTADPKMLPSVLQLSCDEQKDVQAHPHKTDNILFQLNKLSEKIPLSDQQASQKTNNKPSQQEQNPFYNHPNPLDLSVRSQTTGISSVRTACNTTPSTEDNQHPAWVFCTRYSDRPCAGSLLYVIRFHFLISL